VHVRTAVNGSSLESTAAKKCHLKTVRFDTNIISYQPPLTPKYNFEYFNTFLYHQLFKLVSFTQKITSHVMIFDHSIVPKLSIIMNYHNHSKITNNTLEQKKYVILLISYTCLELTPYLEDKPMGLLHWD